MVVSFVTYVAGMQMVETPVLAYFGWAIPGLGAAITAFLSPKSKFRVGALTIGPAMVVMGVGSYVAGEIGFGDNIGAGGTLIVTILALPFFACSSVLGALVGVWVSKKFPGA
jgi:hypothetical protein